MESYKDLLKYNKRSKFRVFLGLSFLVVAIAWIALKHFNNTEIGLFDWIYSGFFILNALIHIYGGFGYSIEGLIGKSFIRIDENSANFKLELFKKEKIASWDSIQSIDYKANDLLILKNNKFSLAISLSKLEYSMIQEIKNTLTDLANRKGIKIGVIENI